MLTLLLVTNVGKEEKYYRNDQTGERNQTDVQGVERVAKLLFVVRKKACWAVTHANSCVSKHLALTFQAHPLVVGIALIATCGTSLTSHRLVIDLEADWTLIDAGSTEEE